MKKFDLKSMCIGIVTGSLLFGGIVGASTLITDNVYLNKYAVTVDGNAYTPNLPILNYAGSTYVPLKEFGTITGATVTFSNNTIVVKKPTSSTTTTSSSTNTSTTKPTSTSKLNGSILTVDADSSNSFYVDLTAYGAKTANVSISSGTAYVSLSQTTLTSSGLVNVKGKKAGTATIKVAYNNGYTDYVTINVQGADEIEIKKGESDYIEVDLEAYDADSATLSITSGKDYITLAKTSVTKSTDVKITGRKAGEATVKVKYDTGDTEYFDIIVGKGSSSDDEIEVEIDSQNGKFVYYIDLDEYDADEAKVSIEQTSTYVKTNSKKFTKSGALTITGSKEGTAEVEIEFLDDDEEIIDTFTIYVDVIDDSDIDFGDYDFEEELEIDESDWDKIKIETDYYDADWATISIISGSSYITLNSTLVTKEAYVEIDGDDEGEAILQVTFSTGDIEYYYIEVK